MCVVYLYTKVIIVIVVGEEMAKLAEMGTMGLVTSGNSPVDAYSPPIDGEVQGQVMASDEDL